VIRAEILAGDGSWVKAPLLADTGADRTVFSADVLEALTLPHVANPHQLGGVGGVVASVLLDTQIRLTQEDGNKLLLRGRFAAFTALEALDMSALGRDVTNLFAAVIDRPGDVVCLLAQGHRYHVERS